MKTVNKTKPHMRFGHVAVRHEHYILLIGGTGIYGHSSQHVIWMYNLYSEQWRQHVIPESEKVPENCQEACAVSIGSDIYMFGGLEIHQRQTRMSLETSEKATNSLWKLTTDNEVFTWTKTEDQEKKKSPSPRYHHSGWEYNGMLWIYGGGGPSIVSYLHKKGNGYGDYAFYGFYNDYKHVNNQLLCFDPSSKEWMNPKYSGVVPTPRIKHATAAFREKVWIYGGCTNIHVCVPLHDYIYELDMCSLTWTVIKTGQPAPQARFLCSMNAVSDNVLVLHGGALSNRRVATDTWVLDLQSQSWKQYKGDKGYPRYSHTGSSGFQSKVVIIGGHEHASTDASYNTTFHIMLEPGSLQHLSMKTILKHSNALPWKVLPQKLITPLKHKMSETKAIRQ